MWPTVGQMKADTLREIAVSALLSSFLLGLVTQILWIVESPNIDWDAVPFGVGEEDQPEGSPIFASFQDGTHGLLGDQQPDGGEDKNKQQGPLFQLYSDGALEPEEEDDVEWAYLGDFSRHPHSTYSRGSSLAEEPICIGMIVKNVGNPTQKALQLKRQFFIVLKSILLRANESALHFIFLTDPRSVPRLEPILKKYMHRWSSETRSAPFQVTYDYFDVKSISDRFKKTINQLRPYFTSKSVSAAKYWDDLFMIAPFYHLIFPFRRLVMLDIDLKFLVDIKELYAQFDSFEQTEMICVGLDLSPHYMHALRHFRQLHPETHIGEPGRFQGFNTGVVLFDFEKMRSSLEYNRLIMNVNLAVDQMAAKYHYASHLGDQCFFTLMGLDQPQLFHILPCEFNYQLDTMMFRQPFEEVFWSYHNCTQPPKIYHGNGGFDIPENED